MKEGEHDRTSADSGEFSQDGDTGRGIGGMLEQAHTQHSVERVVGKRQLGGIGANPRGRRATRAEHLVIAVQLNHAVDTCCGKKLGEATGS